jgi:hypothetical protein
LTKIEGHCEFKELIEKKRGLVLADSQFVSKFAPIYGNMFLNI